MLRQNEHDHLGRIDGMNDRFGIKLTGRHIAWRDPARQSDALQGLADRVGHGLVLRRIADEYVAGRLRGGRLSALGFAFVS